MLTQLTKRCDCNFFLHIAESDIFEISGYLHKLDRTNFFRLGLCLGLRHSSIEDMKHSETYREDIIAAWLRRQDDVDQKTGIPTWRTLVKALENPQIGQVGIARTISSDKNIITESDTNSQHQDTSEQNVASNYRSNTRPSCTCS